ncbi:MAG: cation:dicarboxylase symporter family transporter [Mesobacillus sp.]
MNIILANPLGAMVEGSMLQVVAFSIIIGFSIAKVGEKAGLIKLV